MTDWVSVVFAEIVASEIVDVGTSSSAFLVRSKSLRDWAFEGVSDGVASKLVEVARCIGAVNIISLSVTGSTTARCAEALVTKVVGVE